MNFETYRKTYYIDPLPEPRFRFMDAFGATLYYADFAAAVAFYERVLGPAGYVEGENTRGWSIGAGWLTLLKGRKGNPQNVEIAFELKTVAEAEALQRAFIAAGAKGPAPPDPLMYRPIPSRPGGDPYGVEIMIFAPLPDNPPTG